MSRGLGFEGKEKGQQRQPPPPSSNLPELLGYKHVLQGSSLISQVTVPVTWFHEVWNHGKVVLLHVSAHGICARLPKFPAAHLPFCPQMS